jgi:hypothetical protein
MVPALRVNRLSPWSPREREWSRLHGQPEDQGDVFPACAGNGPYVPHAAFGCQQVFLKKINGGGRSDRRGLGQKGLRTSQIRKIIAQIKAPLKTDRSSTESDEMQREGERNQHDGDQQRRCGQYNSGF